MKNITDALDTAMEMEKEGYDVYISAAKRTGNKFGRATLEAIAKKELDHMKAIENYSKNISQAILMINPQDKEYYIRPIMAAIKNDLNAVPSKDLELQKAYKIAMGLEQRSYDLYKKLASEAEDKQMEKFFKFLMGEENIHYELLQETLQYLDKTGDWYREQEMWNVD